MSSTQTITGRLKTNFQNFCMNAVPANTRMHVCPKLYKNSRLNLLTKFYSSTSQFTGPDNTWWKTSFCFDIEEEKLVFPRNTFWKKDGFSYRLLVKLLLIQNITTLRIEDFSFWVEILGILATSYGLSCKVIKVKAT